MSDSSRWLELERLYHAALERPLGERASFVEQACADDVGLRRELESLLAHDQPDEDFLDRPAMEVAARELAVNEIEPAAIEAGSQIGSYKILEQIARGGMGVVYRAEQQYPVRRIVALKVIKPGMDSEQVIARFQAERQALALMDHPNIARVLDAGTTSAGRLYFVMELVDGLPITEYCQGHELSLRERLGLFIPVCQAIQHAHQKGVIHRDIKPSNILVTVYDGKPVPKVIDFGIAKAMQEPLTERNMHTQAGAVIGTLEYMSPEQAGSFGADIDTRTDVYSLGVILYELLAGAPPRDLRGMAFDEFLRRLREDDPPKPSTRSRKLDSAASMEVARQRHTEPRALAKQIRGDLDSIVLKALEKDRSRRYGSPSDLAADIGRYLRNEAVQAVAPSVAYRARKFASRHWRASRGTLAGMLAASLMVTAVGIFRTWDRRPSWTGTIIPFTAYSGGQNAPDFSPDGSRVVFTWDEGGSPHLYVKAVGAANQTRLTSGDVDDSYPKWSPDGKWIAFQRRASGRESTVLMPADGGDVREVYKGASCTGLTWSNDSRALVCGGGKNVPLMLLPLENGQARPITSPPAGEGDELPAWSPREPAILFVRGRRGAEADLYLLRLHQDWTPVGAPRRVTFESASMDLPHEVAWTADGREAIWAMSKTAAFALTLHRVPVLSRGPMEALPFAGRGVCAPAVSRQGNRLAFVRWSHDVDIWRADGHSAQRHPVSSTELEWAAQYSPDGTRIAFESDRSGAQEIWVARSDGRDPVQITNFGSHCGTPQWSPDGHWIVFDAYMGNGGWDIWTVASEGGTPRRLTTGDVTSPGTSNVPSFSHDGKWVYYSSYKTVVRVYRVPFAGGIAEPVTQDNRYGPALDSADGKTLYYFRNAGRFRQLWSRPLGGGSERPVEGVEVAYRPFQVFPDGIYFMARSDPHGNGREIRFYDFATNRSRLVQSLGVVNTDHGLSVSPDRTTFLYTVVANDTRNLMLSEGFH